MWGFNVGFRGGIGGGVWGGVEWSFSELGVTPTGYGFSYELLGVV